MKTFMRCCLVLVALGCCSVFTQANAESDGDSGRSNALYDTSCINAAQVQQPACPDTRILDCRGNVIGVKECWGPNPDPCINAAQIQQPVCPDTRILDCRGNVVGVRECSTPVTDCPIYQQPLCKADEVMGTEDSPIAGCPQRPVCKPKTYRADCPVYANPQCRADQRLVTVDVPVQFRSEGCPTTMPLCAPNPEADNLARTPSNRCGAQQRFNATSGRCENTASSCRPFLRFCQRGESPTQTCSCSPTKASEQGQASCVPAPSCPDDRVLNCDATFMSNIRSCKVTTTPSTTVVTETVVTPSVTTTLMQQMEQCLLEYKTEVEKLRERMYGAWAKSSTSVAIPLSAMQSQPWYNGWLQRCGDFFPSLGGSSGNGTSSGSGSDRASEGAGGGPSPM